MRAQRDSTGLEQAKGGHDSLEGRDGADADVALVIVGADRVDARNDQERGLPCGLAHPVQAASLGGHVDGVGADDRGAGELELFDLHLEAAEWHRDLDLAEGDLAAVEQLLDGLGQAEVVEGEVGGALPEAAEEDDACQLGAAAAVGGDGHAHLLEVGSREAVGLERGAGRCRRNPGQRAATRCRG